MIRHTVVVRLHYPEGSEEEAGFFAALTALTQVPGVEKFELLRQVHPNTPYTYGFSMEFADKPTADAYQIHPDHVAFVQKNWKNAVAEFMEIDYAPLELG